MAQARDVARTAIALAVDEDGRGATHVVRGSAPNVSLDPVSKSVSLERRSQRNRIDTGLSPLALQTGEIELILMREQAVVHDPEGVGSLQRVRSLGRFRRLLRMWMNLAQREVAKDRTKRAWIETSQASERQLERPGVRTFVIPVHEYRCPCVRGPASVIAVGDLQRRIRHGGGLGGILPHHGFK